MTELPPPPDPARGWDPDDLPPLDLPDDDRYPDPVRPTTADPVAVAAVALGFLGIVFFGILMAVVVGIVGAYAGQRARESRRSFELPTLAFLLAGVDGLVWIVMHYLTQSPIWIG